MAVTILTGLKEQSTTTGGNRVAGAGGAAADAAGRASAAPARVHGLTLALLQRRPPGGARGPSDASDAVHSLNRLTIFLALLGVLWPLAAGAGPSRAAWVIMGGRIRWVGAPGSRPGPLTRIQVRPS